MLKVVQRGPAPEISAFHTPLSNQRNKPRALQAMLEVVQRGAAPEAAAAPDGNSAMPIALFSLGAWHHSVGGWMWVGASGAAGQSLWDWLVQFGGCSGGG